MLSRTALRTRIRLASRPSQVNGLRCYSRIIQEHDVLLLRQKGARNATKRQVTPPIRSDTTFKAAWGVHVNGSDLIGRTLPCTIQDSKGNNMRLSEVTLAQYVTNIPRVATPIYPHDSSMIVSLLDIDLPAPGEDPVADAGAPFEVFEAGTGMGSLTLHLARAIHGANPAVPAALRAALCAAPYAKGQLLSDVATDDSPELGPHPHSPEGLAPELQAQLDGYRPARRAILHTLDIRPSASRLAHGTIRDFRRALYLLDIDFHVRTIRSFLEPRLAASPDRAPFLSHAVLDLPASADHAELVVEALRPDGRLVVFFPSVTQVLDFVKWVTDTTQPVYVERVIELANSTFEPGFSDGVGGREWDVRVVTPKKVARGEVEAVGENEGKVTVCRPKVGTMVGGGGFVAVFTKKSPAPLREEGAQEAVDVAENAASAEKAEGKSDGEVTPADLSSQVKKMLVPRVIQHFELTADYTFNPLNTTTDEKHQVRKNWDALMPVGHGFFSATKNQNQLPTVTVDPENHPAHITAVFHQLHCLYMIMQAYHSDVQATEETEAMAFHLRHCFEYLRLSLACHGDTALGGRVDDTTAGEPGAQHVCKDWGAVKRFAETHRTNEFRGIIDTD
ncbi:Oxidase ustYa like protein [Verticillium longisporum]|nr:Oxidase ustYa like protein [Verticillium longisporum]